MSEENNINNDNQDTNNNYDDKMAVNFPDWDLLPPDLLLKRPKNNEQ